MKPSRRIILDRIVDRNLAFAPSPKELQELEDDLIVVSPSLMADAILEVVTSKSDIMRDIAEWRTAIYRVYNRKIAEQAQLFPALHCLKTTYRSVLARSFEERFHVYDWWLPSYRALSSGQTSKSVTCIGKSVISEDVSFRLFKIVSDLVQYDSGSFLKIRTGYEFVRRLSLSKLLELCHSAWSFLLISRRVNGSILTRAEFLDLSQTILEARNAIYHHDSAGKLVDVYRAAERLCLVAGFPLPKVHERILHSAKPLPPYISPPAKMTTDHLGGSMLPMCP